MDIMFWMQLFVVLFCIGLGGRFGAIGLATGGGLGVAILVLVFGIQPASPPISVILIIMAVITCASVLQSAGGLDLMVRLAEKILRRNPNSVTFVGPFVCYIFAFFCGTSYVGFSVYPVIAEVATEVKVRPERALSASVIASARGVISSPMSAATAGMLGILSGAGVSLFHILAVVVPANIIGLICACISVWKRGPELENDENFQKLVASGDFTELHAANSTDSAIESSQSAKLSLIIFGIAVAIIITFGSMRSLLPTWDVGGKITTLSIPELIQMTMLAFAMIIILLCKVPSDKLGKGSVFSSGLLGTVAVFGIAWMTGTFFESYETLFKELFSGFVTQAPFLFGIVLFCFCGVIYSPSATVVALMPLGLALGISPAILVALYPACSGDFIIPGGQQISCCSFDRTGTTRIGKFVVNHSYIRPGFVAAICSVAAAYLLTKLVF